jgi:hypothetical protein
MARRFGDLGAAFQWADIDLNGELTRAEQIYKLLTKSLSCAYAVRKSLSISKAQLRS